MPDVFCMMNRRPSVVSLVSVPSGNPSVRSFKMPPRWSELYPFVDEIIPAAYPSKTFMLSMSVAPLQIIVRPDMSLLTLGHDDQKLSDLQRANGPLFLTAVQASLAGDWIFHADGPEHLDQIRLECAERKIELVRFGKPGHRDQAQRGS
jgi:hypothetical protein